MKNWHLTNDERIDAVRGISLKDFPSIHDLEYAVGVLELKSKQMKEEIRKRKAEGRN